MALVVTEVTPALANQHRDALFQFARDLDTAWRCNAAAVTANKLDLTFPSLNSVTEFIQRSDASVLVARDGLTLLGYAIVTVDTGPRGGAYWRWLGLLPQTPRSKMRDVFQALISAILAKYGFTWGRITHPVLHDLIRDQVPGVAEAPDDPQVLIWVGG